MEDKMKRILAVFFTLFFIGFAAFSQEASSSDFLAQGLQAYKNGNWDDAISLLKKAQSMKDTNGPETLYMLVMAQMFKGDYNAVLADAKTFESMYPKSEYLQYVQYQKGRALYYKGDYKNSISVFAKFCGDYSSSDMFSSGLFWMAEGLYQSYHFEEAKGIFERIVNEFPTSAKYTEACYRLDLIVQREKEEKLLYLLKVTSEEFLASKNDFDREMRKYQTSENIDLRTQLELTQEELERCEQSLKKANEEINHLNELIADLVSENENLKDENIANSQETKKTIEGVEQLAEKAKKLKKYVEDTESTPETPKTSVKETPKTDASATKVPEKSVKAETTEKPAAAEKTVSAQSSENSEATEESETSGKVAKRKKGGNKK